MASGTSKALNWGITSIRPKVTSLGAKRSRFVGLMKFVLPMTAAVLIAVVVAWPGADSGEKGFLLDFMTRQGEEATKLGMVNARYVGTDSNNRPFVITADRATPLVTDPDTIVLSAPQADMTLEDGTWLALTARSGVYRRALETLSLEGSVTLFSDDGTEFVAEAAEVDLAHGVVESDRAVSGQGPLGILKAGAFRLVDQGQRLFFSNGVTLVVYPGERK